MAMTLVHGSCVSIDGRGVLILGPSGSGKSDLSLCLMDAGAELVGDDQLEIERRGQQLFATPAAALAGLLEVYGFGILKNIPFSKDVPIELVVSLVERGQLERLPQPEVYTLLDLPLLHVKLNAFAPSTCAKIHAILRHESLPQDQLL